MQKLIKEILVLLEQLDEEQLRYMKVFIKERFSLDTTK